MDEVSARNFLRSVLVQSYGSGLTEGKAGGEGNIGMIGGKPVKFNTHWLERRGEVTADMRKSSDALRVSLAEAVSVIASKGVSGSDVEPQVLKDIYGLLGVDSNGKAPNGVEKPLLTRKITAQIGTLLQKALEDSGNSTIDLWHEVKEDAKDTGRKDTSFQMRQAEVKYENFVTYAPLQAIRRAILGKVAPGDDDKAKLVGSKAWGDFRNELMEVLRVLRYARDTGSSQEEIKNLVDGAVDGINASISKMVGAIKKENPEIRVEEYRCDVRFLNDASRPPEAAHQMGSGMQRSDVENVELVSGDSML